MFYESSMDRILFKNVAFTLAFVASRVSYEGSEQNQMKL